MIIVFFLTFKLFISSWRGKNKNVSNMQKLRDRVSEHELFFKKHNP